MKRIKKSKTKVGKSKTAKRQTKLVAATDKKKFKHVKLKITSPKLKKISRFVASSEKPISFESQPVINYQHVTYENSFTRPSEPALPFSYNKTKLVLMTRDPYSIFCYWDFSSQTWNWVQSILKAHNGNCKIVLRALEVTGVDYNGFNACSSHDIDVVLEAKNWYVEVNKPDSEWIFELGIIDPSGTYHLIVRGNRVRTPRDGPSDVIDERWMAIDFNELYALSGGFGAGLNSGEISKLIKEHCLLQKALFSSFSREINPLNPQKIVST